MARLALSSLSWPFWLSVAAGSNLLPPQPWPIFYSERSRRTGFEAESRGALSLWHHRMQWLHRGWGCHPHALQGGAQQVPLLPLPHLYLRRRGVVLVRSTNFPS